MNTWATMWSGARFDFADPQESDVNIDDIAHGLARLCQFNGQCDRFYSCAEHSVLMVKELERRGAPNYDLRLALLHDSAAAYMGGVPEPLKRMIPDFAELERKVQGVIFERFNLATHSWGSIQALEQAMYYAEVQHLLPHPPKRPEHVAQLMYATSSGSSRTIVRQVGPMSPSRFQPRRIGCG